MDTLRADFLDISRQALAKSGDPDGRGLAALQQVEQADDDSWFDLAINAVAQIPMGFYEGYTTLDAGVAPKSKAAELVRSFMTLWGFIGFVPDPSDFGAAPAKAALRYGTKGLKTAAAKQITKSAVKKGILEDAARRTLLTDSVSLIKKAEKISGASGYGQLLNGVLAGKSVPMLAAKGAMTGAKALSKAPIIARGGQAASGLLKGTKMFSDAERLGVLSDMGHQAAFLGLSSGMSALSINPSKWSERVDSAIGATVSGAVMGGAFGLLGNVGRVSTKLILDGKQSSAEHILRALAGSAMMGLPSTMQGRDTADQVYEYLLGGYFGFHATPWVVGRGKDAASTAIKQNTEVAKSYLDGKDYGRFAEVTGVKDLRAQSPAAGDIMMRELLTLHGLPAEEVSVIMRNPKKYENLDIVEPVVVKPPEFSASPKEVEAMQSASALESRSAWDAEYKNAITEANDWRATWMNDLSATTVEQPPVEASKKDWRMIKKGRHLYQGPIEIDWGTPQQQKVDNYVRGARERARLTNENLIRGFE